MRQLPSLIVLLAVLAPSTAAADMVSPPPNDCPAGSIGQTLGHSGSFCAPHTCRSDDGCSSFVGAEHLGGDPPYACRPAGLCVRERSFAFGGRFEGEPPPPRVRDVASGQCESDADCSTGRCVIEDRCVHAEPEPEPEASPEPDEPAETDDDGGCAIAPAGGGPQGLGAVWLLAALRRRRRATS